MRDICIPIPSFNIQSHAEVEVKVEGKKRNFNYRVESFPWGTTLGEGGQENYSERELRFQNFKTMVENYDKSWELIQIYNPGPRDRRIQVLFRQRLS